MPSIVMLNWLFGNPAMVVLLRAPPAPPTVVTPGRKIRKFNALRSDRGSVWMKFAFTVCETVGVSVRTSSVPAVTFTTSDTAPTSSLVLIEFVEPPVSVASISAVLNPANEIVTLYLPGANPGNEYAPEAFVTCGGSFSPVEAFVTTTVAPGTRPPSLSVTTPLSVALLLPP